MAAVATPMWSQFVPCLSHSRFIVKGRDAYSNVASYNLYDPLGNYMLSPELLAANLQAGNPTYFTNSRISSMTANDLMMAYRQKFPASFGP